MSDGEFGFCENGGSNSSSDELESQKNSNSDKQPLPSLEEVLRRIQTMSWQFLYSFRCIYFSNCHQIQSSTSLHNPPFFYILLKFWFWLILFLTQRFARCVNEWKKVFLDVGRGQIRKVGWMKKRGGSRTESKRPNSTVFMHHAWRRRWRWLSLSHTRSHSLLLYTLSSLKHKHLLWS